MSEPSGPTTKNDYLRRIKGDLEWADYLNRTTRRITSALQTCQPNRARDLGRLVRDLAFRQLAEAVCRFCSMIEAQPAPTSTPDLVWHRLSPTLLECVCVFRSVEAEARDGRLQEDTAQRSLMASRVLRKELDNLRELLVLARDLERGQGARPRRGLPRRRGRRGYPLKALKYARRLRKLNPSMKAHVLRQKCLEKFHEDDLPPDGESFRRWLNRHRANRAN
jgi:hypothetical protein